MKRKVLSILLILTVLLCLCSCTGKSNSTFNIEFIDVGQGDAALIECDGAFMLIDGGDKSAGDKIYAILEQKGIQSLDILAVSHLHADHIGGLSKVLTYVSDIGITLANSDYSATETFRDFEHELQINGSKITIPSIGEKYALGSASVEVIDISADESNDSLVLLITYGDTRFLFTGDIEESGQRRIIEKYRKNSNKFTDVPFKIDLMKMPHHGADATSLADFMRVFMPDYVVISVGANNKYGHPDTAVLDMLNSKTWKPTVYRTDIDGDIFVISNGNSLKVTPSR